MKIALILFHFLLTLTLYGQDFGVTEMEIRTDNVHQSQPPSLYGLVREPQQSPEKILLIFKTQKKAHQWTEGAGLVLVTVGGILLGKAEYYSRYHGTTSDFDSYHITRDIGLLVTGAGAMSIGMSFALDDDFEIQQFLTKTALAALLNRTAAEATYEIMKP